MKIRRGRKLKINSIENRKPKTEINKKTRIQTNEKTQTKLNCKGLSGFFTAAVDRTNDERHGLNLYFPSCSQNVFGSI